MAEKYAGEDRLNTIIGQGTVIKGECAVNGTVRVDGVIDGSLSAKGMAILGKSGQIKGDMLVQDAIVGGHIDGSVIAEGRLELQSGASVQGDITARRLIVEEGVFFHGACSMKDQTGGKNAVSTGKDEKPKPGEQKASPAPVSKTSFQNQPQDRQKIKIEESGKDSEDDDLTFHGRPL